MSEKSNNQFLDSIIKLGSWIYNFFMLQALWVLYSLKGVVVLGVFPATISVSQVLYRSFKEENLNFSIFSEFKDAYNTNFKRSNQVGYIYLLIYLFLYVDLRISNVFIQSIILHTILILLLLIVIALSLYSFIVIIRYELSLKDIFKQSFFVALSVPTHTIAAIVGLVLIIRFIIKFNLFLVFFGIPLLLLPVIWFTYTGCLKAEEQKKEITQD